MNRGLFCALQFTAAATRHRRCLGADVKIQLNGEPTEVPDAVTIEQLLERLGVDARRVAVEHNLTIIKRHRQAETVINEGDEVEIVNFVGGG